jgi:hypothetical protein
MKKKYSSNTSVKNYSKSKSKPISDLSEIYDMSGDMKNVSKSLGSSGFNAFFVLLIIVSVAILLINVNAIIWINKLEDIKCACSENWMRSYIKNFLYIFILFSILNIVLTIYMYSNNFNTIQISPLLSLGFSILHMIISVFGFINIFIVIIFINKLKEINCVCSEDIRREVYYIYNTISLFLIAFYLFLFIGAIIFNYIYYKK